MKKLHLFEGIGVELEYMIVQRQGLEVLPVTDQLIAMKTGEITEDVDNGAIGWSNELVLHVLELKTNGPAKGLTALSAAFHENIKEINNLLHSHNAMLMPTAMHPLLRPADGIALWPHGYNKVYARYDAIFNTKGHGWSNVQSTHINLPFHGDEEFARLHAAIRLVLPLIPALAAASPLVEGKITHARCNRLVAYKQNQAVIPCIAGLLIPEKAYSKADYQQQILDPMYKAIAPYDTDKLLQHEWLNSRAAIARFDRNAIEIRIMDNQECPLADLSIIAFIVALIRDLVNERYIDFQSQADFDTQKLSYLLEKTIIDAEQAIISDQEYLSVFGAEGEEITARDLLLHISESTEVESLYQKSLIFIIKNGSLSTRLLKAIDGDYSEAHIKEVYAELSKCLANNQLFSTY